MRYLIIISRILTIALLFITAGCSKSPEKRLNEAIESFLQGVPDSLQKIELELLNKASVNYLPIKGLSSSENFLYTINSNVEVHYPIDQTFSIPDKKVIEFVDLNEDYFIAGTKYELLLYKSSGSFIQSIPLGEEKKKISGAALIEDKILYYKDKGIFLYHIILNSKESYLKGAFPPPYNKFFKVSFFECEKYIGVLTGIAGSYYYDIINKNTESMHMTRLSLASSKLCMKGNFLYYVTGTTGNWEIMRLTINSKQKKKIRTFKDIIDIEFSSKGFIIENSEGLWVSLYSGDRIKVPFQYRLAGKCQDKILLTHNESSYLVDPETLFMDCKDLSQKIPELFP